MLHIQIISNIIWSCFGNAWGPHQEFISFQITHIGLCNDWGERRYSYIEQHLSNRAHPIVFVGSSSSGGNQHCIQHRFQHRFQHRISTERRCKRVTESSVSNCHMPTQCPQCQFPRDLNGSASDTSTCVRVWLYCSFFSVWQCCFGADGEHNCAFSHLPFLKRLHPCVVMAPFVSGWVIVLINVLHYFYWF